MTAPPAALKILVVEDNYMIATLIEHGLTSAGWRVSGPVPRLAEALDAASRESYDAAVLDINLHNERIFPVADLLSQRNVPYLFVTGYNDNSVPAGYAQLPRIVKPFKIDELLCALSKLVKPANGQTMNKKLS